MFTIPPSPVGEGQGWGQQTNRAATKTTTLMTNSKTQKDTR